MALRISTRLMRSEEHDKGQGQKEHSATKTKANGNSKAAGTRSYAVLLHPEKAGTPTAQVDVRLREGVIISDDGKDKVKPTELGEWPMLRAANGVQKRKEIPATKEIPAKQGISLCSSACSTSGQPDAETGGRLKVQEEGRLGQREGTISKERPARNGVSPCSSVCLKPGQLEAEAGRGRADVRQEPQEEGRTHQRADLCQTQLGETGKLNRYPAADQQIQQADFQNGKRPAEAGNEGTSGNSLGEGEQAAHVSNLSGHGAEAFPRAETLPRFRTLPRAETFQQQTERKHKQQQTERQTGRKTGDKTEGSAEQKEQESFGKQSGEEEELNFANSMDGRGKMEETLQQQVPKEATGKAKFGFSFSNKEEQVKDLKHDYGNGRASWKEVVVGKNNRQGRTLLNFYPPKMNGEEMVVIPPPEVEETGSAIWKNCLVGYFVGRKLPFMFVQKLAWQKWRRMGLVKTLSNSNGFFIFVFDESANLDEVMEGGFAHFANHLLMLKKWDKDMELDKEPPKTLHIWVHLSNVPLHLWHGEGFSYIASAIGKPLFLDEITEDCERLRFARVCVEVAPDKELPWEVKVLHGNGKVTMVRVAYPWKPPRCSDCFIFGHSKQNCPKALKAQAGGEPQRMAKVWRKRVVNKSEEELKQTREPVTKQKQEQKFQQVRIVINAETVDEVESQNGNVNQEYHEDNKGRNHEGVEVCGVNREQDIEGILSSNAFESLGSVEAQDETGSSQAMQPKKKKKEKKKKKTVLTEDEGEKGNEGKEGPSHCL